VARGPAKRPGVQAVFLTIALCLAIAPPLPAEEKAAPKPGLGPLEKSLLIPGWGQLSEKRYVKGSLFLAAEIALLYGFAANNSLGNENYGLYKKAETMDDAVRYRRLAEKYDTRRNRFLLAAAAVWGLNLLDISLIVNNKDAGGPKASLRIEHGGLGQIRLAASYRF
jgi:hypothetical protein